MRLKILQLFHFCISYKQRHSIFRASKVFLETDHFTLHSQNIPNKE